MKVANLFLLLFVLSVFTLALHASSNAYATSPLDIQVDKVDRVIAPIYGGLVLINDTIMISPKNQNTVIEKFPLGFPLEYRKDLRLSIAYDTENPDKQLNVDMDTGLGVVGYHGVTVNFPDEVRDLLYEGQSYTFTVVSVFSDLVESSTAAVNATSEYVFTAGFPLFPSLAQDASICNVTVILPKDMEYTPVDFPFKPTQRDGRYYLTHGRTLSKLSDMSARVSYSSASKERFACFSLSKMDRETKVDTKGHITVSESFVVKSETTFQVDAVRLQLPSDAVDVLAYDEQGKKIGATPLENETDTYQLILKLEHNRSRSFRVTYNLHKDTHLVQSGSQTFELTLNQLESVGLLPETMTTKISFPEGAIIHSFPTRKFNIQRDVFSETLSLSLSNVTWLTDETWSFTYSYSALWASFRPTVWATALVIVGSVVALAWRRPRARAAVVEALVPRTALNEFVEAYEGKKRILSDVEELKQRTRRGKISRRRYKIRKTTLENRLSTLSKRLAGLRMKILSGGAMYADMMRQLEVAEIELDNIEADIKRIEVRFKRGEISAQTYRRLLEGDLRRREKARTTIDGVLLRLRE